MKQFLNKLLSILILLAIDIFVVSIAFWIAIYLRDLLGFFIKFPRLETQDPLIYQISNWWIIPLYALVFFSEGLYSKHRPFWQEVKSLWKSIALTALFVYSFISLGRIEDYFSRTLFVLHPLVILVVLPLVRRVFKSLMYRAKYWQTPIVELRIDTDFSMDLTFARNTFIGYHIESSTKLSTKDLFSEETDKKITSLLKAHNSDTLLLVIKDLSSPEVSKFVEKIFFLAPHVLVVPENMDLDVLNADIHYMMYNNTYIFDIKKGLNSPIGRFTKRLVDIVLSTIGIIVLSPIFLLTYLYSKTKVHDGSPILKQPRFGLNGKMFTFYKFRYMRLEKYFDENYDIVLKYLENDPKGKEKWIKYQKLDDLANDPRIIKGMHKISKYSLDELPQLFNVLKGDMSIVGPRPFMPREKEMLGEYFNRILAAKPGLTDIWTVSGRNSLTFEQRLKMGTWYIQNWTIWLDFIIIMKTIQQLISFAFKWLK